MLTWTLTLIWSMVLLGAAGVIWLMLGTFRLEQRRGDFVSAVTHELRTPLTSFPCTRKCWKTAWCRNRKAGILCQHAAGMPPSGTPD